MQGMFLDMRRRIVQYLVITAPSAMRSSLFFLAHRRAADGDEFAPLSQRQLTGSETYWW